MLIKKTSVSKHPGHRWSFIMSAIALMMLLVISHSASANMSERGQALRKRLVKDSGKAVGAYRALIIGINDYKDPNIPDLETAVNDARKFAELLKSDYGFSEVILLLNGDATESRIIREFRRLITKSSEDDSVLIYYAGHGELEKETKSGWWIPYDAIGGDPSTYLDNSVVQKYIKAIPARHVLLVADSCFSGSLFGERGALPGIINDDWYGDMYEERSRWGMTSGNLTPVSDIGSGGHSVFAYQFLKALKRNKKPYLTPQEIHVNIGPKVRNNSQQKPRTQPIINTGDQGGQFIFIRTRASEGRENISSPSPLPPLALSLKGHLQVNVNVAKARVLVNGKFYGTASEGAPLNLENLGEGSHRVRVESEGYAPLEKQSEIKRNRWTQEAFILRRNEKQVAELKPQAPKGDQDMVYVKGGCYEMGDTFGDGYSDEKPVHEVCVDDFYIGKYEVTQGRWKKVMGNNPSFFNQCGQDCPVESVSWNDVQDFIHKLNSASGESYRLPTEAEWEYTARSGGKGEKWAGTSSESDLKKYAWNDRNSGNKTHPVGRKKANGLGLYDMTGNVWEWVSDWYGAEHYKTSGRDNPKGPVTGEYRVLRGVRGGSWVDRPNNARAANRGRNFPGTRTDIMGFRLARSFSPLSR